MVLEACARSRVSQGIQGIRVASRTSFTAAAAAVLTVSGLLPALLADVPEWSHLSLSAALFFLVGLWELDDRVHACSFALAAENALVLPGDGRVSGKRSNASDARVSVDCGFGIERHFSSRGYSRRKRVMSTEGRKDGLYPRSTKLLRTGMGARLRLGLSDCLW
jgi:hypothetical protein